jgi:hypothetical protein
MSPKELTVLTREETAADRFIRACAAGRMSSWAPWQLESVAERVARGETLTAAVIAVKGADESATLFEVLENNDAWQARFVAAERAAARKAQEELVTIADDKSGDVISGPKGDIPSSAAVGRSKLMVETRQWLMGRLDRDRFGDGKAQTNVQVNVNYAATLEEARERAQNRGAAPKISRKDAIDVEAVPVRDLHEMADRLEARQTETAAEDHAWMDADPAKEPGASTLWRE